MFFPLVYPLQHCKSHFKLRIKASILSALATCASAAISSEAFGALCAGKPLRCKCRIQSACHRSHGDYAAKNQMRLNRQTRRFVLRCLQKVRFSSISRFTCFCNTNHPMVISVHIYIGCKAVLITRSICYNAQIISALRFESASNCTLSTVARFWLNRSPNSARYAAFTGLRTPFF